MPKLMIFCTCTEYKKEHYLTRVSNWYHNLRAIKIDWVTFFINS